MTASVVAFGSETAQASREMRMRRGAPTWVVPGAVVLAVGWLVLTTARPDPGVDPPGEVENLDSIRETMRRIDARLARDWKELSLPSPKPADDLTILRRLSLALIGTVPSLQEIRRFEDDRAPDRLERWTARMLSDPRFADYFAERLARAWVGSDQGQFIVFRRDRFRDWLSQQLRQNRPYNELVRAMITEQGLWTGQPATNFVTAAADDGTVDVPKLAGRTVRAFLGQRIDCAQCHDHPFDHWTQEDFHGLAAFYGEVRLSVMGVNDDPRRHYQIDERSHVREPREAACRVPFQAEALPAEGRPRERLAAWITHPSNRRFERAIANRIWALMFGKPFVVPVDQLPDPGSDPKTELLDILGEDLRTHGYDLRRMIQVIAGTSAFRASSEESGADDAENERAVDAWQTFPLVRLRPEQVIGSMLQAGSVQTIDQNAHLLFRLIRFFRENDFLKEYGDLGEMELDESVGTIPQALLRMNGKLTAEIGAANPFTSLGRIAAAAPSDDECVAAAYLVCLTRRPTDEERAHFVAQLRGTKGDERARVVEDLFWSLFNSPEFSWNH